MATLFVLAAILPIISSKYTLETSLNHTNFFDGTYWRFFTASDPNNAYTNYVKKSTAQTNKYISTDPVKEQVYIGCDNTTVVASVRGRDSVRLESKQKYNGGLFMLHLEHMPTGCGTWPAWWSYGPNWPQSGEIDIIEGVNTQTRNWATLHTSKGCNFCKATDDAKTCPHPVSPAPADNFTGNKS